MPRQTKRKTEADRPKYHPPSTPPIALPEQLQPFLPGAVQAGVELRRIVEEFGMANVQAVLGELIAQQRREMIERRASEIRDGWKSNLRPMMAVTTTAVGPLATSDERRRARRYRRHREEEIDSLIRKQKRNRQLNDGLAAILESKERMPGYNSQVAEIVARVEAGQSVAQIAQEMGIDISKVERRLRAVREAAAEAELPNPCPLPGLNEGLGPGTPLEL